ncbi:MAG: sugar kinase [Deinococcota bacterium]
MPRFDVTTIGEGNLRLSVPAGEQLEHATNLNLAVAGAEGNVAGALAHLGWQTGWVSKLPQTSLAKRVLNTYKLAGLDTSAVCFSKDERLATLFVEYAAKPRVTNVIFDRQYSAFSQLTRSDVNWEYLLDTRLIHLTGITAALSDQTRTVLVELVARAKQAGVAISFDVNYREKLWSLADARAVLMPLVDGANLLFCSQADAARVFGCAASANDSLLKLAKLTNAKHIVMSCADQGILAWNGQQILKSPAKEVEMIDRIGAGDGLAAGVLHGYLHGDFVKGLEFGCIMAALAISQFGEMVLTTDEELEALSLNEHQDIVR